MNDLLTISEYSKIRGCSVSAVYKRLKSPSNRLHTYVVRQGDQIFLKAQIVEEEGLSPLATTDRPPRAPFSEAEKCSNTTPNPVEEVEEGAVEEGLGAQALRILEQQLIQKDKEIADLNRRLEEAEKHEREMTKTIADLAAQANELHRNNQVLMLAQAQQQAQQIEAAPEIQDPIVEEPEIQKKPGLWARIFGSRRNKE